MPLLDWPGLLRVGIADLRLTPDVFWRLTPIELKIMLGAEAASPPLTRARLDALSASFPDMAKGARDGNG